MNNLLKKTLAFICEQKDLIIEHDQTDSVPEIGVSPNKLKEIFDHLKLLNYVKVVPMDDGDVYFKATEDGIFANELIKEYAKTIKTK